MQDSTLDSVGFRVSPQQERLLVGDAPSAVVQCAAELQPGVDSTRLRRALEHVVAKQEILRTAFVRPAGMRIPQQVVRDELPPSWTTQDAPAGELLAAVPALLAAEAHDSFNLERGPLVRALHVQRGEEPGLLALTVPAVCADPESLMLILGEVARGYTERSVAEDPIQYADYAEWRHELVGGEQPEDEEGRAFWRGHVDQPPTLPRVLFGSLEAAQSEGEHESIAVLLGPAQANAIQHAAQASGVSVPVVLEAAWHALIARVSGATELLTAGWCDGRAPPDLRGAIGPYAQLAPIRSQFEADTSFSEILDQLRRARAGAARMQDYASASDLEALPRLAGIGFAHIDASATSAPITGVIALTLPSPQLPLLFGARTSEGSLQAEIRFDPAAFERSDAEALATRYAILLSDGLSDPARPVSQLTITDAPERERILASATGLRPTEAAATPVHHLFEHLARLHPDAPAVADAEREVNYVELNAAANRLAHLLRSTGIGPGAPVGLCMERSSALLEALLGILKAGGAYVPLNYEHPPARLNDQLSEACATVVVAEAHLAHRLGDFDGEVICIDRDHEQIASFPSEDPEPLCGPEDVVYVMYTSGSTGLPKGVAVTHANLANYAMHMAQRLSTGDAGVGMRFGVVSAISTDLGNTCIFPALVSGGCVQLVSPGASMDGEAMAAELGGKPLDVLKITPSHLRAVLAGDHPADVLPRRWLILGGEALSWELVARIRELAPACRIINHYGPTETTIGCCAYDVGEPRADAATVPIGWALAGERAYVVDSGLELLPPGVPGELCIAGEGVAAGYVGANRDGNGAFRADPFSTGGAVRMYRTGDRARYLRDGAIEFLGRVDDQVKIRGYRIEPGEIEAALARHSAIRQAAVTGEEDDQGALGLVAYLVSTEKLTVEELREFLGQSLPEYMIPSTFATLEALPFTPSGKIDRKALRGLAEIVQRRQAEYVAPRTPLEQTLADSWAQLLGVERVGVEDDFFALGGHSLLAAQVVARVRTDLAVDLPLHSLFAHPTITSLTSEIVTMMGDSEEEETAKLVAELEGLSDEEAERLLSELGPPDPAGRL